MLNTATKSEAPGTEQELTDGFHLVIDALKLNGINTIYNVPGIPITDLGRMPATASPAYRFMACWAASISQARRKASFPTPSKPSTGSISA